jgi:hypothetical protein
MGDRRKCQTFAASPAEPGGLPVMLAGTAGQSVSLFREGAAMPSTPARHPRKRCGFASKEIDLKQGVRIFVVI